VSIAPLALTVALVAAGAAGCSDGGREAARTYQARCARCHGSDGRGDGRSVGLYPRLDLTASPMVRAGARARGELFLRIADGYGAMPGFAGHLETSEMQDLADYVLRLPREKAGR
jgi:mono/diheme cytochrome c family protein